MSFTVRHLDGIVRRHSENGKLILPVAYSELRDVDVELRDEPDMVDHRVKWNEENKEIQRLKQMDGSSRWTLVIEKEKR